MRLVQPPASITWFNHLVSFAQHKNPIAKHEYVSSSTVSSAFIRFRIHSA